MLQATSTCTEDNTSTAYYIFSQFIVNVQSIIVDIYKTNHIKIIVKLQNLSYNILTVSYLFRYYPPTIYSFATFIIQYHICTLRYRYVKIGKGDAAKKYHKVAREVILLTKQELARNFALNVERERLRLGMTQAEMAKKLEMSLSGYKKMISGETTKIDAYAAFLMYDLYGKWLFEMIEHPVHEAEVLAKMKHLTENQLRFISAIVNMEYEFLMQQDTPDEYISVIVPTGNMQDGMIYDSGNVIKVNAAVYRKRFGSDLHFGIKITSSHLHPVYTKGDIILISQNPIRDGDTGVFINKEDGRMYIRKFHQAEPCLLEPINGFGQTFHVNNSSPQEMEKWIKVGYVLSKMRQ